MSRRLPVSSFSGRGGCEAAGGGFDSAQHSRPAYSHFRVLAEHVKHGVLEADGFPLEFPVTSLGETLMRPTAMLY